MRLDSDVILPALAHCFWCRSGAFEVVRFVRELASKQSLPKPSQLAARMASVMRSGSGDPFAEAKSRISDIARLEDEAAADA